MLLRLPLLLPLKLPRSPPLVLAPPWMLVGAEARTE
jgi:hypothetical protein